MTLGGHWSTVTVLREGTPVESQDFLRRNDVAENYFQTLEIPLLSGRALHPGETGSVIVNERFAAEYWPEGAAVGR